MNMDFLAQVFLWFMAYCFIGWVFECVYCSINERRLINRGFLNGPYIPIYGCGALFAVFTLGDVENPVLLFFLGVLGCCTLEYFTSYAMERLFHARWWDYSNMPLNLNGRICAPAGALFGLGCVAAVDGVQPLLAEKTSSMGETALYVTAGILLAVFIIDTAITCASLVSFRTKMDQLRVQIMGSADVLIHAAEQSVFAEQVRGKAIHWRDRSKENALVWLGRATLPLKVGQTKVQQLAQRFNLSLPDTRAAYELFHKGLNLQEKRIMHAFPKIQAVRPQHLHTIIGQIIARLRK